MTVPAMALALASCGGGTTHASTASSTATAAATSTATAAANAGAASATSAVSVSTSTLHGLGSVLVDGAGRVLYLYVPDHDKQVKCVALCARLWPPLKVGATSSVRTSGAVRRALLGSDADPEGGRVLTYGGWPLYTYVGDTAPATATGQGLEGGLWYVVSPSGRAITATP